MEAIAEPYADYVRTQNDIASCEIAIDAGRAADIINWAADNIIYDGEKLRDALPIDDTIKKIWDGVDQASDALANYDALNPTTDEFVHHEDEP
jgi:hypothetical protein